MRKIQGIRIGAMGNETLQSGRGGKVMGVTSTGAFLHIEESIVFLTSLPYLSPFNLQVSSADALLQSLQPGDTFQVVDDYVSFPSARIGVAINQMEVWVPGPPVTCLSEPGQQLQIVDRVIKQIHAMEGDKGFLFLAGGLNTTTSGFNELIVTASQRLFHSFQNQDLAALSASIETLLGAGGGLTPSGDDFLTGFFLCHIRLSQSLGILHEFTLLALDEVIRRAREKTTTISINRLQATRRGWAEDIFLSLLDHLFDPDRVPMPENLPQKLLNFGHSSGVDTLVGINFAISSLIRK